MLSHLSSIDCIFKVSLSLPRSLPFALSILRVPKKKNTTDGRTYIREMHTSSKGRVGYVNSYEVIVMSHGDES